MVFFHSETFTPTQQRKLISTKKKKTLRIRSYVVKNPRGFAVHSSKNNFLLFRAVIKLAREKPIQVALRTKIKKKGKKFSSTSRERKGKMFYKISQGKVN